MPPKRAAPTGTPSKTTSKNQRSDHAPEEFSNAVKKRLLASTRTGQACDRCKVRKIRCDGLPGGCSPCIQNNVECRTTDRITGRATSRGYVEGLEEQNREMSNRIRELEQRLIGSGVDIKPSNGYHEPNYDVSPTNGPPAWNSSAAQTYAPPSPAYPNQEANMFRTLPAFRAHSVGDNYLGVATNSSHLSSIRGTALSILGMEIDIADFSSPDVDEPDQTVFHPSLYNKSYQSLLQSIFNINPKQEKPELPPRDEGLTYAQWYFRALNPYNPILHKKSFLNLLTRIYDDPSFRPSAAESVMVHMVFAIMFFQYSVRNEDIANQAQHNNQSNLHYHYSLGLFDQLMTSHTLADVQAMTLICAHLRNFPKPGASWMLSMLAMVAAIEIGLHRSVKRWQSNLPQKSLEVETRKRVFWALLTIHMTISTKLGRPTALRLSDFDVEIPEPVNDEILTPENDVELCSEDQCAHSVGLYAWRLLPLILELFGTIYAVRRRPNNYVETVNRLEAKWRAWTETLPSVYKKENLEHADHETRVFALWAEHYSLEYRLLLRHPSVSMTTDEIFNAENMRICVECSRSLLQVVREMQKFKSLDTTWYNNALYVMAVTTTLFAQWEKRNDTTPADLASIRQEMDLWLGIMNDLGTLIGSGPRLREAVRVVTDGTLGLLERSSQGTSENFAPPSGNRDPPLKTEPTPTKTGRSESANVEYPAPTQNFGPSFTADNNVNAHSASGTPYIQNEGQMTHQQTPYPVATQYSGYPEPPASSAGLSYPAQDGNGFTTFHASNDPVEAPLLEAFAAQASQVQSSQWRPSSNAPHSGSQGWHQWTSTMAGNLEPQDCYSANALMQLGGRDLGTGETTASAQQMPDMGAGQANTLPGNPNDTGMNNQLTHSVTTAWPINIFDMGQVATGSQGS